MSLTGFVYGALGYYKHLRGQLDEAEAMYKKMNKFGCTNAQMVAAYGLIQMRKGEFQDAVETFNRARDLNPKPEMKTKIRLHRAVAYYKLGDLPRALKALENIKETVGVSERLYEFLGYMYIAEGDLEKALAFNLEAYDYEENNNAILDNLGQTYLLMGDWENARLYCEKAMAENDNQVDTLYHMAQIELHDGNVEKAKEYAVRAANAPRTALNEIDGRMLEELIAKVGA